MTKFFICADPNDISMCEQSYGFASTEETKNSVIEMISKRYPLSIIYTYDLCEMRKVVEKPRYMRYVRQANGEIIPV